jgi:hypothetical protein
MEKKNSLVNREIEMGIKGTQLPKTREMEKNSLVSAQAKEEEEKRRRRKRRSPVQWSVSGSST